MVDCPHQQEGCLEIEMAGIVPAVIAVAPFRFVFGTEYFGLPNRECGNGQKIGKV
jgi:hypothetical protein